MKVYLLFRHCLWCVPVRAHTTVAAQHMLCLWAMKYKLSFVMHVYWKYLGTMGTYTKYNITRHISTVYTMPLTQTPIWNELIPIVNSAIIQSGLRYPPVDLGWTWVARSEKHVYKQLAWFVRSRPQTPPSHKDEQSGEPSWIYWASADFVTESPRNILCQTCSKKVQILH